MSNFFDGQFFDGGFFDPLSVGGGGGALQGKKAKRGESPVFLRFCVELGGETHYFRTESEARSFMEKQARTVYKRARAVSRRIHRIELPGQPQRIPLRAPVPIPRFVAEGSASVQLLTQRINARIDAILANPERDADEDDADLERILSETA
jgi:hypothetical protein